MKKNIWFATGLLPLFAVLLVRMAHADQPSTLDGSWYLQDPKFGDECVYKGKSRQVYTGNQFQLINESYGDDDCRDLLAIETVNGSVALSDPTSAPQRTIAWTVSSVTFTLKTQAVVDVVNSSLPSGAEQWKLGVARDLSGQRFNQMPIPAAGDTQTDVISFDQNRMTLTNSGPVLIGLNGILSDVVFTKTEPKLIDLTTSSEISSLSGNWSDGTNQINIDLRANTLQMIETFQSPGENDPSNHDVCTLQTTGTNLRVEPCNDMKNGHCDGKKYYLFYDTRYGLIGSSSANTACENTLKRLNQNIQLDDVNGFALDLPSADGTLEVKGNPLQKK
jgi:hypothetical protein